MHIFHVPMILGFFFLRQWRLSLLEICSSLSVILYYFKINIDYFKIVKQLMVVVKH